MSSNEDDFDGEGPSGSLKKRRIQRACDICRRKKIRCDGVQMPGNRCSNCTAYGLKCTYVETAKKRGPSKGYVEGLEHKIEKMEKLLRRLCPDESVYQSILNAMEKENGPLDHESLDHKSMMAKSSPSQPDDRSPTLLETFTRAIRASHLGEPAVGKEDDFGIMLADLRGLAIENSEDRRFFGKSSGAMLIQNVMDAKREYAGSNKTHPARRNIRPEFWIVPEWERATRTTFTSRQHYVYPPADLAEGLIDNYFRHANLYLPLLHRRTFEEGVALNLHHDDSGFASVYMLVCSLGSKFSDDPRVKYEGEESSHSAGWQWFNQTVLSMKTPMSPATLYDIQSYALAVQFLAASASPHNCWTLVGIGLRVVQDVGAHIKRPRSRSAAEDESWKRAFWVLYVMDRLCSSSLGRPCAIQEEDFDMDLPNDCDDEYWNDDDLRQPEGVPSKMTAFILLIKLTRILSVILRTIYATNKSKISWGYQEGRWEETVVAELDSALNSWVDMVPSHLRWDPNREDKILFDQSVMLYSNYYFLQIIVHRPFIPNPSKPSRLSFPSLAICANAARSCSHLADIQRRRTMLSPINQMTVSTAAIILLLNLWSGKKSGLSAEVVKKDMGDVLMCMEALKSVERRWPAAGRLWDLLSELACVGDLPLPELKPPSNKRPRGSNGRRDVCQPKEAVPNENRNIAGSRRAKESTRLHLSRQESPSFSQHASPGSNSSVSDPSTDSPSFSYSPLRSSQHESIQLPMYSTELGKLPLHGPFTFRGPQHPQATQQTSNSSTSPGAWYPTYAEPAGVDPLSAPTPYSTSSSSSLHQQQPLPDLMNAPTRDPPSERAIHGGAMPGSHAGYPTTLHRFLQETPPFNVSSLTTNQERPFDMSPNRGIPAAVPLRQQVPEMTQMDPGPMSMAGIDLGTMNSDVMSMWLNASPTLLMDDWSAYFATLGQAPQNQHG